MKAYNHAQSSAREWGGDYSLYLPVHEFIDSSKAHIGDMRHRALLHSTWGCYLVEQVFGTFMEVPKRHGKGDKRISIRDIAERHILEDLGRIPSVQDYMQHMELKPWMGGQKGSARQISWEDLGFKQPDDLIEAVMGVENDLRVSD